ncbi:Crp/Fnr family transcriptional regulator [Bacillus sp. 1P06AnD]|uniref:Crp/Fnr family transcriptional regulator n=1 Tax=Bacillus sp. 1P06AnD TaxID=3132208 RepID=UPI0039A07B20
MPFTAELQALLMAIGTKRNMIQHDYLFLEGMDNEALFFLESGLVRLVKGSSDGKELIMRICRSGELVGEAILSTGESTYALSAEIIRNGEAYAIPKGALLDELGRRPKLSIEMLQWSSLQARKQQMKLRDFLLYGKKGALYSTLIRLSNSYGIRSGGSIIISLPFSHRELAGFCQLTRESVNRLLRQLIQLGVIHYDSRGRVVIDDFNFLKSSIQCENCPAHICNIH